MSVFEQLNAGMLQLGLTSPPQRLLEQLINYAELLQKWNKVYNLTAITDLTAILTHHLLDSLAVAPYLIHPRIIDVGTGAGLPGLPLALLCPQSQFVLLDSNGKKTRFLTQVKLELAVANVEIVQARCEAFKPKQGFNTVISRAFSSIAQMLRLTRHLLAAQGQFLAMKGAYPGTELAELNEDFRLITVHNIHVPGLNAQRHLVCLNNRDDLS